MTKSVLFLLAAIAIAGCGDSQKPADTPSQDSYAGSGEPSNGDTADHGEATDLGEVEILGHTFAVTRLGDVVAGKEAAFRVMLANGPSGAQVGRLSLFLWLENEAGKSLNAATKGSVERGGLHFHATPRKDAGEPKNVVLRLRANDADDRAKLPLDGHGHVHEETPHHGIMVALEGGAGHLELKLHDDKGDLELWLTKDSVGEQPLDLPLSTIIRVTLIDKDNRTVELRIRNGDRNEDEDDVANIRDGKTNYFVFPGATGADATWLQGKTFNSLTLVKLEINGKAVRSEEFSLAPHVH